MDSTKVPPRSATELAGLLDSPEIADLTRQLEATRWTGRPGYPIRAMVGMALAPFSALHRRNAGSIAAPQ